jgi:hypothetical protein
MVLVKPNHYAMIQDAVMAAKRGQQSNIICNSPIQQTEVRRLLDSYSKIVDTSLIDVQLAPMETQWRTPTI